MNYVNTNIQDRPRRTKTLLLIYNNPNYKLISVLSTWTNIKILSTLFKITKRLVVSQQLILVLRLLVVKNKTFLYSIRTESSFLGTRYRQRSFGFFNLRGCLRNVPNQSWWTTVPSLQTFDGSGIVLHHPKNEKKIASEATKTLRTHSLSIISDLFIILNVGLGS